MEHKDRLTPYLTPGFLFSPDHLWKVNNLYREIMSEIAASDLLQDILRQITGNPALVFKKDSVTLGRDILASSYMLS